MTISTAQIDAALQAEDVEGLIGMGAPRDEYSSEAKEIASAIAALGETQVTEENIAAVIAPIWQRRFSLSNQDIAKRMAAFRKIAQRLL